MADLDDLLGGGDAKPTGGDDDLLGGGGGAGGGLDDMDDLLGGGGDTGGAALDDDLLFGDDLGGPAPSNSGDATAGSGSAAKEAAPAPAPVPEQMNPLSIPVITHQSEKLNSHLQPNTYYIRYIMHVQQDGNRVKRIIIVTDKMISVINENGSGVREIDIRRLFGVILQNKVKSGKFGSQQQELHTLLEIDGDADLYFVQIFDTNNGDIKSALTVENALTAIIAGWGLNLPVAFLREQHDELNILVRWVPSPDVRIRHQLTESLAFRSELQSELEQLRKKSQQQDIHLLQLKSSQQGMQAENLTQDIQSMEENIEKFQQKINAGREKKVSLLAEKEKIMSELAEEEKKRNDATSEKTGAQEQEMLVRRAKENELMKAAHKRELDKINFLTDLYQQHATNRGKDSYSGVQVTMRLEELEEELDTLKKHKTTQAENHKQLMTRLQEVKKRLQQAKSLNERLTEENKVLEEAGTEKEIPTSITRNEIPDLGPVELEAPEIPQASPRASPPPASAPAPAAKKAPISLDDDDDDDLPVKPAPKKAPIALDDDDDI